MAKTSGRSLIYGAAAVAVAAAVYLAARGAAVGGADPGNAAQVARGKAVYVEYCASCHGARLEGQANWRLPLAEGGRPAPPHDQTGHTWHHPDRRLFDITRQGGQPFSPSGYRNNMPGFGDQLSDADIWAVLAYVKSRWPDPIRRRQAQINARAGG